MPPRAVGRDLVRPIEQLGVYPVRYWPERPHLSQVMRRTVSLPTMSRKMMAPSRGITTTVPSAPLPLSTSPSALVSAAFSNGSAAGVAGMGRYGPVLVISYCRAGTVLGRRAPRCTVPRPPGWLLTIPCPPPWLPAPKLGPAPTPVTPPGTPPSIADPAVFGNTTAINEMHHATQVIFKRI